LRGQRAAGIEPRLDAKRRKSREEYDAMMKRRAELEAFKRDHPDEYYEQMRGRAEQSSRTIRAITYAIGALAAMRP